MTARFQARFHGKYQLRLKLFQTLETIISNLISRKRDSILRKVLVVISVALNGVLRKKKISLS